MELIKYEAPIKDNLPLDLIEEIFGRDERLLETPQLDGTENEYNKDIAYLAMDGDTVLGMVHATIPTAMPTLAGISGVCTTPAARGRGIGKLLYGKMMEEIDALGVEVAVLGTGNPIAAKMYSSFGFNYLPCSGVMIRLKRGGVVDFTREFYESPKGKIVAERGTPEMRISMIPLVLQRSNNTIFDRNINLVSTYFMAQSCCMSLYPRYLTLEKEGGHYFGAYDERRVLGAIGSIADDGTGEYRADFFALKSYKEAIPLLLERMREISPSFYVEIAANDGEKAEILSPISYKHQQSTYNYGGASIATIKYFIK